MEDPRGFLRQYAPSVVLDEIQKKEVLYRVRVMIE